MVNQPATQQMIKDILDGVTPAGKVANALTLNINGEQTEYDGSAAKSVTIQSGESALTYGDSIAATNAPVVSNGINLEESNFNRTPVANDTFIAVVTYGGNTYLCNFTVMSVIDHVQCRYDSVQQVNSDSILGVGNPIQTTLTDTPKTGDTFTAESANFNIVPDVNEYVLCAIKLDGMASYKAQAPFVVVAQCTEVSDDSLTMTVRSIYSAPPLHFMSSREGNTSIGASYTTGSNLFDRTPINGETFECLVKIDGAFYVQTCRVTGVGADNVVTYYTLEGARQIGSAPSVKLYAHHISMVLTTVAGSGRLSMTIIDSTSAAYNSVAGVAGRLSLMGLNTSAESHDATGYISYNGKAYIIYGIYAATITSIIVNCYNAEDHQDAPTGIDSATVTDTVIAKN